MDSSSELDDLRQELSRKNEYIKYLRSLIMNRRIKYNQLKNMCERQQQEAAARLSEELEKMQETFEKSLEEALQLKHDKIVLLKDVDYLVTEANEMCKLKIKAEERSRKLKNQLRQLLGSTPSSSLAIVALGTRGNNPVQTTETQLGGVSTHGKIITKRMTSTTGSGTNGVRSKGRPKSLKGTGGVTSSEEQMPGTSTQAAYQKGGKKKPYSLRGGK